ncbi:MAG: hypothetical protein ACRDRN_00305 [Sciscionella sp.]
MAKTDVRRTREQVTGAVGDALEQVRTPLLAALGAGDLATQAVVDVVNKAKSQVGKGAGQSPVDISELRQKLRSDDLRKLVDVDELRKLVDVKELRELVDSYTKAAVDLYEYLASHGEGALDKLRAQPQVKQALQQLEDAVTAAQGRVEGISGDAREFAEDVLSRVSRRTRSVGEKAGRGAQSVADEAAEAVSQAGGEVASETRSVTRKTANKASAAKPVAAKTTKTVKPEPRAAGTTSKTNGASRTEK